MTNIVEIAFAILLPGSMLLMIYSAFELLPSVANHPRYCIRYWLSVVIFTMVLVGYAFAKAGWQKGE